nr:hypothetical protein [Cnaphalocrocis medinalis granulovirus]
MDQMLELENWLKDRDCFYIPIHYDNVENVLDDVYEGVYLLTNMVEDPLLNIENVNWKDHVFDDSVRMFLKICLKINSELGLEDLVDIERLLELLTFKNEYTDNVDEEFQNVKLENDLNNNNIFYKFLLIK